MPHQRTFYVHISDVQRYKQCRQAWDWSSPLRANLTPVDKYAPFFTGSLVHHIREMASRFDTPIDTAIKQYVLDTCTPEQQADPNLLEQIDLARGMMQHYELWQKYDKSYLADLGFEFISPEHKFEIVLWKTSRVKVILVGTFDGIVKSHHDNKYYLWELKTTRSIAEREKQLELDSQADSYTNSAQRIFGYPISGIVYTLMRKKIPEFPKILNSGYLSQATNQDTTAEFFLQAIKAHHTDVWQSYSKEQWKEFVTSNYAPILNHLAANENKYFKRVVVNRSQYELQESWDQLIAVTKEMVSARTPIYLNESYSCNYCIFRRPCIAKRQGKDWPTILNNSYVFNDRYADEIGD